MKYELRGEGFLDVVKKAKALSEYVDIIVESGSFYITNYTDYCISLELLRMKGIISDDEYISEYKHIYNELQNIKASNEDYLFLLDDNCATIYNDDKYLSFTKIPKEPFAIYMIEAADNNDDKLIMNSREIPFSIRKDSPIYENIDDFYRKNKEHYILSNEQTLSKNYIRIDKSPDGNYKLVVVKKRMDLDNSDSRRANIIIGDSSNNEQWMTVDYIYDKLCTEINRKKVLRKK